MKCKTKREMQNPKPVFTAAGAPATEGTCPVCGTKMFRMGRTPAHEGLEPPPVSKRSSKKRKKKQPARRKGKLVIVESPAKARTVGRFLGKGYTVKASVGHVRDLLRSQLSVDVEHDFQPKYRVPNEKRKIVKEIKALAEKAEEIYLATDPDREGEAIAWHLMEATDMAPERTKRVVFHEITKPAIEEAFSHPRGLNMALVDAQQARRVLDRLVGYTLSPILWRKVRSRLSAGRVQSVALRLVVEREREIEAFTPEEYWTIDATFSAEGLKNAFSARLHKIDGQDPQLPDQSTTEAVVADMREAGYQVAAVKRGQRKRRPAAPFTTSTMQQEASRRLGFTARRTMAVAQQLYEGINVGEGGSTGLITYMRTDSTNISPLAQRAAREYIAERFGNDFLPPKPPRYRTRAQRAQEAHEAIRPTSVFRTPEKVKPHLSRDQYRLYRLIWQRFVASQMAAAIYDTLSVQIKGQSAQHQYLLRASGSMVRFAGFLVLYEEAKDEDKPQEEASAAIPPEIAEGMALQLLALKPEQHFTQPPPRYTEATLVRTLEENGIGRPSTYAPILSTLQQRGYVRRENKRLVPTEDGKLVNDLLVKHFPDVIDVGFTAKMEENLDKVAAGETPWVEVVREFYLPFSKEVEAAEKAIPEMKRGPQPIGRQCPECGGELVIRWGRYGKFIGCSNFPKCRYTEPWLEKIGVKCPKCGGEIVERRTRRGRVFYGCVNYPECDFTSWKRPLPTPCPQCGGLLVVNNRSTAQCTACGATFPLDEVRGEEKEEGAPTPTGKPSSAN